MVKNARNFQKPLWYESNLLWGPVTLGAGIVLTVVAAMKHDLRFLLILAALCFICSSWIGIKQLRIKWLRWLLLGASVSVTCGGLFWLSMWLPPEAAQSTSTGEQVNAIDPALRDVWKRYEGKLGKPEPPREVMIGTYQAAHHNATVIWIDQNIFRLKEDRVKNRPAWDMVHELTPPSWRDWVTADFLIPKFPECATKSKVPYSGIAYAWDSDKDRSNWAWIGCRQWHFLLDGVHYQDFEHGYIIGGLRNSSDSELTRTFILLNGTNGVTWTDEISKISVRSQPPPMY